MNGSSKEPMRSAPQKKGQLPSPTMLGRNGDHQCMGTTQTRLLLTALPSASQVLEGPDASDGQLREGMGGAGSKREKSAAPSIPSPTATGFQLQAGEMQYLKTLKFLILCRCMQLTCCNEVVIVTNSE